MQGVILRVGPCLGGRSPSPGAGAARHMAFRGFADRAATESQNTAAGGGCGMMLDKAVVAAPAKVIALVLHESGSSNPDIHSQCVTQH